MSQHAVMATSLVGRHSEVATIDQHVDRVLHGSGSTLLVSGEAGIGKSRIIRELKDRFERAARSKGAAPLLLSGQCYETDQALPYAPLLDLLRLMLFHRSTGEVSTLFGADASDFALLLPELTSMLPDQSLRRSVDPQQEKQRLFQVLLRLFIRLAAERPLLVVIEDLHWSDDTSLDFLLHLARRLDDLPILLVLSYRSDEIQPSLRHALATLDRERQTDELQLERLTPAEVDGMMRSIFHQLQAIQADFLETIYGLTDGNPFFIEEVLRALIQAGEIYQTRGRWDRKELTQLHIPRSVQDAVARRADQLSPQARELLQFAAVAGRAFDFAALEALTRYTESELLALIRDLIDAQLVVEESADRFAFRHALTRQAVYGELLERERRALHLAIGETLERLHGAVPESHLADLAYHFAAAEDWPRALDYARRAGERALRLFTPRSAVDQFTRALVAEVRLHAEPSSDLYRSRAQAYATLGAFDLADRDHQTMLKMARDSGDRSAEWRALLELGNLWSGLDYARAGAFLEQALSLARDLGDRRLIADSLTQVGGWLINREQTTRAEEYLEEALSIFTELDNTHGVARAVDLLGTVADLSGDMIRMQQRYQQAAWLFRRLDDRAGLSSTLATGCIRHGAIGLLETIVTIPDTTFEDVLAEANEASELARSIDWRAGEAYAVMVTASCLGWIGRYADAFDLARVGLVISTEIEHREWMTGSHYMLGSLYLDVLDFKQAHLHFDAAAQLGRESGSLHWLHLTTGGLADVTVAMGSLEAADELLASVASDLPVSTLAQRRVWLTRVRLALSKGDGPGALEILDRLVTTAANVTDDSDLPLLLWLRGQALTAIDDLAGVYAAFLAAQQGAEERGMRPLLWRIHHSLSELHGITGRAELRDAATDTARRIIEELDAELPDDDARSTFRAGVALLTSTSAVESPARDSIPLTARERDVTLLLTRGLSNREIAEELYVGERTVETHVGNILAKLGFRSRTQVATWAIEQGLAANESSEP